MQFRNLFPDLVVGAVSETRGFFLGLQPRGYILELSYPFGFISSWSLTSRADTPRVFVLSTSSVVPFTRLQLDTGHNRVAQSNLAHNSVYDLLQLIGRSIDIAGNPTVTILVCSIQVMMS